MIRIAHISDLHFSKITFNPLQFLSKRWVGNFNLLLNRKKSYKTQQLEHLPDLFKKLDIKLLCVSGDFSSTSQEVEFIRAQEFFKSLDTNITTFFVPGNHDQYTKSAYRKKFFYNYFQNQKGHFSYSLENQGIEAHKIDQKWWIITLDTAIPTPYFSCSGLFSKKLEKNLLEILSKIPDNEHVILINHFPLIQDAASRKILKRRDVLINILRNNPKVKIYLHGHTHLFNVEDYQKEKLPLMIGSGCTSHKKIGSWNLIEIDDENNCQIKQYNWNFEKKWHPGQEIKVLINK